MQTTKSRLIKGSRFSVNADSVDLSVAYGSEVSTRTYRPGRGTAQFFKVVDEATGGQFHLLQQLPHARPDKASAHFQTTVVQHNESGGASGVVYVSDYVDGAGSSSAQEFKIDAVPTGANRFYLEGGIVGSAPWGNEPPAGIGNGFGFSAGVYSDYGAGHQSEALKFFESVQTSIFSALALAGGEVGTRVDVGRGDTTILPSLVPLADLVNQYGPQLDDVMYFADNQIRFDQNGNFLPSDKQTQNRTDEADGLGWEIYFPAR